MNSSASARPSLLASAASAVGLSILFLMVYGGCLHFTALRNQVGTCYMPWELRIPLVPAMIVPYWSIDLLFVMSFFLCASVRELQTLTLRLGAAIGVAGFCFLLFPLRTAYPPPTVGGLFGVMFDVLHGFDMPYNCAPSLHIAIAVILGALYVPKTPRRWRWLAVCGFVLIGISTLLTWQHHVIDVVSGAALGLLCLVIRPGQLDASSRRYLAPETAAAPRSDSSDGSSVMNPV